ncbi:MAG: hypothetical protein AB8G86_05655 [Saprospiraceae bacterium]
MAKKVVRRTSMIKSSLPSLEEVNKNIGVVTGKEVEVVTKKAAPVVVPKVEKIPEVTKLVRLGEHIHTIAKTEASRRKMKLKEYMEFLIKKDNPDLFK